LREFSVNYIMSRRFSLFLFLSVMLLISCEDVVEVDMPTAEQRLVVDASINWQKGTDGAYQRIRLTTTAGYYDSHVPFVEDATVYITDSSTTYEFIHTGNGYYGCSAFQPQIGEAYKLHVEYQEELYTANEILMATPDLLYAEHVTEALNEQTIKAYFYDPQEENFYMSDFYKYGEGPDSAVFDDKFVNGNLNYTLRFIDDLQPGDTFLISLYGVSERYYDYMMKLYSITEVAAANPFKAPPVMVRGNVVNETNPNNYAFGYFRLSEESSIEYIVQ